MKFKRCISICRNALLKVKTTSRIKRFQEDQELGAWFSKMLQLVKTVDTCQPEQSVEPVNICSSSLSSSISMEGSSKNKWKQQSVPIHESKKNKKGTEALLANIKSSVAEMKEILKNDPSRELLDFLKSESEQQKGSQTTCFCILFSNDHPTTAAPLRILFSASNGIISTTAWIISAKFT